MVEEKQVTKVYICSSVGMDYFFFLKKTIESSIFSIDTIFLISENTYRNLSKITGIKKIYLRLQMYIFYPILLIYKATICKNNSIFVVTSNTFFAPLIVKIVTFYKRVKVIHLLYDLYPDAIEMADVIKVDSGWSKLIGFITKLNQKKCDATVYLGDFLSTHAQKRWGISKISRRIDISTDLTLYDNDDTFIKHNDENEKVIIHYGGQLGYLHDAESIIECVRKVLQTDLKNKVEFVFYVSGAQSELLRKSLNYDNVKVRSSVDSRIWRNDIRNFHIGLVSLSPGGASVCLPSKTYSMMAGGLSIIAICPMWSDLSNLIISNKCGWIINNSPYVSKDTLQNGDYLVRVKEKDSIDLIANDFVQKIRYILNDKKLIYEFRKNSFLEVRENYSLERLKSEWHSLLNHLNE